MKKYSKLIVLLLPLIIAGCRRGGGSTTSSPTTVDPTTINPTSGSITTTAASSSASSQSSEQSSNTFTTSIAGISKELTVATSGSYFTTAFSDGTSFIDDLGVVRDKGLEFVSYFNGDGDPLLASILGKNVTSNTNQDKKLGEQDCLKIGSKNEGQIGELKLTFNYQVTKIEIEASAYYKAYEDWQTHQMTASVDTTAGISIDSERTSLETAEATIPTPKVISKSYASPVNTISLKADEVTEDDVGKRVFVNYIKITYIA